MTKVISVHSFRGGTGKSNTTANLAGIYAAQGMRVGVVDTDIQSPGIHVLFGQTEDMLRHSLNDYLWGKCAITDCAQDVTAQLGAPVKGQVYLIPSSIKAGEIARILREGYDVGLLSEGFEALMEGLNLDILLIDTHPGLNEETLLSIAISDVLVIILRPDSQDYMGTGVTVEIARKLGVPGMYLVVNKVPALFNPEDVKRRVEMTYNATVAAVLPHSDEMMALASSGIFVFQHPNHEITRIYQRLAQTLAA